MKEQKVKHWCFFAIVLTVSILSSSVFTHVGKASQLPSPLIGDARTASDIPPKHNSPITPGYYETSEYLIGSVAVGVILLESNGTVDLQTENWTLSEESQVISEIQAALDWWSSQNPSANVSFSLSVNYRVPTSYEPIIRPSDPDQGYWIDEAMDYLGYSGADYFSQVRDYINDLRNNTGTNWAFAMFVVDSSDDSNGAFEDDYFAYAYIGGPFLVMTYDNDNWGIDRMDRVTAHEMGHIFYATDEYDDSADFSGYLSVPDVPHSSCLMDTASWCLSGESHGLNGTWGQVGWRDSDGDSIQDIVDTFPDTTLNPYVPDPAENTTLVYTGAVTEVPYPNSNPLGIGRNVTTNTIISVQFRIDNETWINANATDGVFDEAEEDFTFTIPSLSSGTHVIETRGINSVGNAETSYSNDTVTIKESEPPTTTHNYDGSWHTTNFTISLVATDLSGVAETYYKINDGSTKIVSIDDQPNITTESANNTLEYWSIDNADNEELPHKILTGIRLDKIAPTGSIIIGSGDTYTNSTSVMLTLGATDSTSGVYQVRFSNDNLWDTEPWETPSSTKAWTLTSGDGIKDVYYQIKDEAELVSETYSDTIILDTTPPIGSITINDKATHTTINTVTLTLSATDETSGIVQIRFSNDNSTWTLWEDYTNSKAWSLTVGDGTKVIYYQIKDQAELVSDAYYDTIVLDTNPPLILETFPSNGTEVRTSVVEATWNGADETSDIDHYEIRLNDGSWINIGTNTTFTFTGTSDGTHILHIKAIDEANNYKQVRIHFSVNTSLIGEPRWNDDLLVISIIGFLIVLILLYVTKKRRKEQVSGTS
ncbi:MAG: hypothetical protein PVF15_07075 [Candidatus Bathyarchaeota archaeon]|jgi:hypothetical protein